jgi:type I restriction enzyme S subunit
MSRIGDLIVEHCPEGVPFHSVEELFELRNGYTPSKNTGSFWEDGNIPWFRMEDIRANGRILRASIQTISDSAVKSGKLFPENSILISTSATIGEHALVTVPHLSNQRFTSMALKPKFENQFDIKFVFYYCFVLATWCRENTTMSSFAGVDMSGFKKFKFPAPPLSLQQEIVRILDTFTDLDTELNAELDARKKQFEHYRNSLLAFPEYGEVRWVPMGEVGQFIRGNGMLKNTLRESGFAAIHYGQVHTFYGAFTRTTLSYVEKELRAKRVRVVAK